MSDSETIRVGLIGYGFSGRTFHAPLIASVPGLNLTAVVSTQTAKVQAELPNVEVYSDAERLLRSREIDLIVIATPNDSHASFARAALGAGKHVVIDKPFALNMIEARDLVQRSEAAGLVLSVFQNRRWDSDFLSIRAAIVAGLAGRVRHFESHFDRFRPNVRNRWRDNGEPGSGIWFDLGPHLVDQALLLFGLPDRIYCSLARQRTGAVADDWAHAVLEFGETRAVLHAGVHVAGGATGFVAHGDKGSIYKHGADRQEEQLLSGLHPGALGWGADPDPLLIYDCAGTKLSVPPESGDQRNYYISLVKCLKGLPSEIVTPIEALAVMATIEAGVDSARQGMTIELPLTDAERALWQRNRPLP